MKDFIAKVIAILIILSVYAAALFFYLLPALVVGHMVKG